jgi:signal transduction histidine kinase
MAIKRQDTAVNVAEEAGLLAPSLIHEMRQPLTGARAGLELLARRRGTQLTSLDDWGIVITQLERIEELFRAYQDFLHPEKHPPTPFEVAPVIERAVALQIFRLRRLGARFSLEIAKPAPVGFGASKALLHAATNVLANALDALDEAGGGGRLCVRVLATDMNAVQVRVSDEGPGIPEKLRDKIFEPRFTTKAHGSGLGLAIAQRMMSASGGHIELAAAKDPLRLPWAKTESVLTFPPPPRLAGEGR